MEAAAPGPFHRSGQMGHTVSRRIGGLHAVGIGTTAAEARQHEVAWFAEDADAFLFEAAPAMLAALEAALQHLDDEAEIDGDDWDLRATLTAALALARGEVVRP